MKIGVAGAGAVGSLFGGLLHKAGHQVTFLARGDHLEAMNKQGLFIDGNNELYKVDGSFTSNPDNLSESDLVLFCVKSNDTRHMASELVKTLSGEALILTMQNGIDNEEILSEVFGRERILSAATYVQAGLKRPGNVRQHGNISLVLGELDSQIKTQCSSIVQMFNEAGIRTKHADNIIRKKWNKLLWNVTFNPLSAIVSTRVGEILENGYLRNLAESICLEAISVAKEMGVSIERDKMLSQVFKNAEYARAHRTSMLQDRLQGKKMEVESVCGYIVRKGEELQVDTPTLRTVYGILKYIDK